MDFTNVKYEVPNDKWFKYQGVRPPERQSHGISEDNIEEVIRKNSQHVCEWKQKGNYIFCNQGENEHGKNVGVFKRLIGTKNGEPVLINI